MENNEPKSVADPPAIESVDSVKKRSGKSRWSSLRRWLRYATLASLGAVFCVTLVFWIRSYWRIDHLHGILWGEHRLFVRSGGGEIVFTEYTMVSPGGGPLPPKSWDIRSYESGQIFGNPNEFEVQIALSISQQSDSGRPVQILWKEFELNTFSYSIIRRPPAPPNIVSHGIVFPHLLLLLINGSLFFLIFRRWQFGLRTFFIWVTIICVAMACAVVFVNHAREIGALHAIE